MYTKQQQANLDYLTKTGFKMLGNMANYSVKNGYESFKLECPNNHEFLYNVNTLNTIRFKNTIPVCKECKANKLLEKHDDLSDYIYLDDRTKIECKKCERQYHASCSNKKCFCELSTKKKEELLYSWLVEAGYMENYQLAREYTIKCFQNKKFDLALFNEEEVILFEVDDIQHFYKTSKTYEKDKKFSKYIFDDLEDNGIKDKNVKLIRINDKLLIKEGHDDIIEKINKFIEKKHKKHFCVIYDNYGEYNHLINLFTDIDDVEVDY